MNSLAQHRPVVEVYKFAVLLPPEHAPRMQVRDVRRTPCMMHRTSQRKHRDVPQSSVAVATHTTDANIVVARLEMNNGVVFRVADAARPLFRHQAILNFMKDSAIMPGMVKLRRGRGSLDSTRRPLLPAPRDGDALPLPPIFS